MRIASRIQTVWAAHPRGNPCRGRPAGLASLASRAALGWFILGPSPSVLTSNRVSCLPFRRHCARFSSSPPVRRRSLPDEVRFPKIYQRRETRVRRKFLPWRGLLGPPVLPEIEFYDACGGHRSELAGLGGTA